jgi:ppGpp synthetase/RelA/SpoT-type nucleotidyltranferase
MELELFNFIDQTIQYYELKKPSFAYAEGQLKSVFEEMTKESSDTLLAIKSRIKSSDSLREKLIRNRFYLNCEKPEDALKSLSDLIGITMECRFIRNEVELYQKLFQHFNDDGKLFSQCKLNPNVYMNLHMAQPQIQRNGFTIYRIDGFYVFNEERINFELQIKSLVHTFWSEIEHEVVYKNPDFVMYDTFNKNMLGAIRDNLDVVDRQLEIMYNEISYQSQQAQIGMDEKGFKTFVAQSINELMNRKMKESVGFATDFKQCSSILAQYIYVKDFLNGTHNPERMIDYLQLLNYLTDAKINFKEEIFLEHTYISEDPFNNIIGGYWQQQLNKNFQWHIFFCMLFTIQPGNNVEDFSDFINVIHLLLIQPSWYAAKFASYEKKEADTVRSDLAGCMAQALVSVDKIDIIHEEKVHDVMEIFRTYIEMVEREYPDFASYQKYQKQIQNELSHRITVSFQ